jgi:hypothetical protein
MFPGSAVPTLDRSGFALKAAVSRRRSIGLTILAAITLVAITLSPWRSGFVGTPKRGSGDVALYQAEAERIRDGQSYYHAAKAELEGRGYPTRSVFNWRTPLPVWFFGVLPPLAAQGVIAAVAAAVLLLSGHLMAKQAGLAAALLCLILLIGALLPVVLDGLSVMPEVWSGVLIAASLACFGIERRGAAVSFGLLALLVRELAAPYCVVCGSFAIAERRWKEVAGWLAGAAASLAFYAWHLGQVLPLIEPDARAHSAGWVQCGGAAFVLSLVQMNSYLLLLPQWVSAMYLAVALLGFTRLSGEWGVRAACTAAAYLVAFGFVGQPFNQYWGAILSPLFCYGAARGAIACFDWWRGPQASLNSS